MYGLLVIIWVSEMTYIGWAFGASGNTILTTHIGVLYLVHSCTETVGQSLTL